MSCVLEEMEIVKFVKLILIVGLGVKIISYDFGVACV